MKEIKSVLTNYKFVSLWVSQILSQLTVNILSFIILIHLFNQTGSTIATSLLWVAYAVPAIVFGPIAAASVDLTEKRRVLMLTNLLQSVVVFFYAILLYKQIIYLSYTVVFLYSLLNQFYVPAEAADLPLVVEEKDLPAANGLFFITQQSSLVLGFGVAGILNEVLGFRPTLLVVGVCLFLAFISVSFLPERKPSTKLPSNFEKAFSKFFNQIIDGYNFIKNTREVLFPFLLLIGIQVIFAVVVVNLPRLATDILGVTAGSSGFTVIVPAGIGAIIGTLIISKLSASGIRKRKIILTSLFVLAFSILAISVTSGRIAIIFFVSTGFGVVGALVPSITYLQEKTPKDLLGRVFGNFWFLTTLATVVPVLVSASITDLFGIRFLLVILGLVCTVVAILSGYKVRQI